MPDPALSAAIEEAYASAPVGQVIYHTLEVWHPAFGTPVRIVRDRLSIDAKLEAAAPRNPGAIVTFTAMAFEFSPPELTANAVPQCTIEIDNVDRAVLALIETTTTSATPIEVMYRVYLSDALAIGPENQPVAVMTIQSISADPFRIRAVAGFPDLLNKKFPNKDYELQTFPGLAT